MSTGLERFSAEYKVVWGNDDLRERVTSYLRMVQEAELYAQFGGDPLTIDALAQFSIVAAPDDAITVDNDSLRAVVPSAALRMRLLRYGNSTQVGVSHIFREVPFEAAAGIAYLVGVRWGEYPTEVRLSDAGIYKIVRWKEGIGESGQPLSVTDNGDGTITLVLADAAAPGTGPLGGRPWAVTNGGLRPVTVWLETPRTGYIESGGSPVGEAVHTIGTVTDGSLLTVTIPHAFGQTSITTVASRYRVFVHGPSIWRAADRNLLTYTEGSPAFKPYAYLGSVTDGVVSYTSVPSSPSLSSVRLDLQQIAADVFSAAYTYDHDGAANLAQPIQTEARLNAAQLAADLFDAPYTIDHDGAANKTAPLEQLLRVLRYDLHREGSYLRAPAVYFSDVDAGRTWWTGYTPSTVGDTTTFTWAALPSGTWILTRDASSRNRAITALASVAVDFDRTGLGGFYTVFIEAEEQTTTAGSEATRGRIRVAPTANAEHTGKVVLLSFFWDGATISGETQQDPGRDYRARWDAAPDRLAKNGDFLSMVTVDSNTSTKPRIRLRLYEAAHAIERAAARVFAVLEEVVVGGNVHRSYGLTGPNGEGAALWALSAGSNFIRALFGGTSDWKVDVHADQLRFGQPGATGSGPAKVSLVKDGGGQDTADTDGHKPFVEVGDVKLPTGVRKIVRRKLPIMNGRWIDMSVGTSNPWQIDATIKGYWSTTAEHYMWFETEHRVGEELAGFAVSAYLSGSAADDKVIARIFRIDTDTGIETQTYENLDGATTATAMEWVHGEAGVTLPKAKDVLLSTVRSGAQTDRWVLEIQSDFGGVAGATFFVAEVAAIWKVKEL